MDEMVDNRRSERMSLFREATMAESLMEAPVGRRATYQRGARFNYKPLILRTGPSIILLSVTVALIAVLQYAAEKLPQGNSHFASLSSRSVIHAGGLHLYVPRSNETSSTISYAPQSSDTESTISPSSASLISSVSLSSANPEIPSFIAAQSDYLQTETQTINSIATSSTAESAYLQTQTQTITSSPTVTDSKPSTAALSAGQTDYLQDNTQKVSTVTGDNGRTPSISPTAPAPITSTPVVFVTTSSSTIVVPDTLSSTLTSKTPSVVTSQGSGSLSLSAFKTTVVPIVLTITSTPGAFKASPSPSVSAGKTSSGANNPDEFSANHPPILIDHLWSPEQTFLATYLPVLVAVLFRVVLTILYNNLNLIEPFRQMSHPQGASAARAIFAFYQNPSTILGPFVAFRHRRWVLGAVATAYLVACFMPALASEAIFVDTNWGCQFPEEGNNPCPARMACFSTVIRVLQGLLAFIAVVLLALLVVLLMGKTGLPADPSSIATIASLMRHPGLMEDLSETADGTLLDVSAMKGALNGKQYTLRAWKAANGEEGYGIVPLDYAERDYQTTGEYGPKYTPVDGEVTSQRGFWTPHRFRYMDFALFIVLAGTFGVVLAYYIDGRSDGFNNFFNSTTFGPRFVLTGAGTLIASIWRSVEQSSVVMAPYVRLAQRPSAAGGTILFTPSNTPILSTIKTLRARYLLVAVLTVVTVTAEALSIVIGSVPLALGEKRIQFLVSTYMSLVILAIMMIVLVMVMLHRRHEPRIPARPDTLAAKMNYLCGSRVVDDFEGTEWLEQSARDDEIRRLGKKYYFGMGRRKDGRKAWVINDVQGLENGPR